MTSNKRVALDARKGNLVLIGGAEDRRDAKWVLRSLVEEHKVSRIAIIPTATLYPGECSDDYYYAFRDLGVSDIEIFDIRESRDARKSEYLGKLERVQMVFFTGGDQVRLTRILLRSPLIERIKERFHYDGLHIAGTSAGAAAAANPMTFDGDEHGLIKGTVKFTEGFGFLENITIDTHFVARGRLARLTQFLCHGYTHRGIGIGEDTSITITPDQLMRVTGNGITTLVSTEQVQYSNFNQITNGEKISIEGVKLAFLQHGSVFDLKTWTVVE